MGVSPTRIQNRHQDGGLCSMRRETSPLVSTVRPTFTSSPRGGTLPDKTLSPSPRKVGRSRRERRRKRRERAAQKKPKRRPWSRPFAPHSPGPPAVEPYLIRHSRRAYERAELFFFSSPAQQNFAQSGRRSRKKLVHEDGIEPPTNPV